MNRAVLVSGLLLAGASSTWAVTSDTIGVAPYEAPASAVYAGVQTSLLELPAVDAPVLVFAPDPARTFAQVKNTTTWAEVICINSSFPGTQNAIRKLRFEASVGWSGVNATAGIYCIGPKGTQLALSEYSQPAENDPDSPDDANVYAAEPTSEPSPTPTPDVDFGGGDRNPSAPAYNPSLTPTPTPALFINDSSADGTGAASTPTPTPNGIVVD